MASHLPCNFTETKCDGKQKYSLGGKLFQLRAQTWDKKDGIVVLVPDDDDKTGASFIMLHISLGLSGDLGLPIENSLFYFDERGGLRCAAEDFMWGRAGLATVTHTERPWIEKRHEAWSECNHIKPPCYPLNSSYKKTGRTCKTSCPNGRCYGVTEKNLCYTYYPDVRNFRHDWGYKLSSTKPPFSFPENAYSYSADFVKCCEGDKRPLINIRAFVKEAPVKIGIHSLQTYLSTFFDYDGKRGALSDELNEGGPEAYRSKPWYCKFRNNVVSRVLWTTNSVEKTNFEVVVKGDFKQPPVFGTNKPLPKTNVGGLSISANGSLKTSTPPRQHQFHTGVVPYINGKPIAPIFLFYANKKKPSYNYRISGGISWDKIFINAKGYLEDLKKNWDNHGWKNWLGERGFTSYDQMKDCYIGITGTEDEIWGFLYLVGDSMDKILTLEDGTNFTYLYNKDTARFVPQSKLILKDVYVVPISTKGMAFDEWFCWKPLFGECQRNNESIEAKETDFCTARASTDSSVSDLCGGYFNGKPLGQRDTLVESYCIDNPLSTDCQCTARLSYKTFKDIKDSGISKGLLDACWWRPCKILERSMLSTTIDRGAQCTADICISSIDIENSNVDLKYINQIARCDDGDAITTPTDPDDDDDSTGSSSMVIAGVAISITILVGMGVGIFIFMNKQGNGREKKK